MSCSHVHFIHQTWKLHPSYAHSFYFCQWHLFLPFLLLCWASKKETAPSLVNCFMIFPMTYFLTFLFLRPSLKKETTPSLVNCCMLLLWHLLSYILGTFPFLCDCFCHGFFHFLNLLPWNVGLPIVPVMEISIPHVICTIIN